MPKVKHAIFITIEVKMELFHELMGILQFYEIMTMRSPVLGFTEAFRESDKMHLLALGHICNMCLDMVDNRYNSMQDSGTNPQLNEMNISVKDDSFENYVVSAEEPALETLEEKLINCVDIIHKLRTAL